MCRPPAMLGIATHRPQDPQPSSHSQGRLYLQVRHHPDRSISALTEARQRHRGLRASIPDRRRANHQNRNRLTLYVHSNLEGDLPWQIVSRQAIAKKESRKPTRRNQRRKHRPSHAHRAWPSPRAPLSRRPGSIGPAIARSSPVYCAAMRLADVDCSTRCRMGPVPNVRNRHC
jgi:hypothetical protein